jgi:hypothetical protein
VINVQESLCFIIEDGIQAARESYSKPSDSLKLAGAIRGFEDCRGKSPFGLKFLLAEVILEEQQARLGESPDYWFHRCRSLEVRWVCNVLSCILVVNGFAPISGMTARGMIKAADIIGVGEDGKVE